MFDRKKVCSEGCVTARMFVPTGQQNIFIPAGHLVISAREVRLYLVSVDVVEREGNGVRGQK